MSDQGATAFPSQTMVECGICGETFNVNWFCKNCLGSICDTCNQAHKRAAILKNHLVVPRTLEVLRLHGPAKIAEICRLHPTKEISTYCNDCNIPCCVLCHHEKHKQHDFSPIEDKYLSAEKNLDQYVRELKTDVKPSLDDMKESLKQRLHNHEVQKGKVKNEINSFRRTLKQKIDESCDLLLKEIDEAEYDLRKFEIELESSKQKLDQLIKDVEIMIGEGKLDIIEYTPPNRASLIPNPLLPVLKSPKFVPRNDLFDMVGKKIGKIEFKKNITDDMNMIKGKTSENRVHESESKEKSTPGVKSIDKFDIEIRKVTSFESKIGVISLTTAGNDSAWVMCNDNDTMYLYDSNGDVVRSVKVNNSIGINDMVITRSGDMIVTCRDYKVRHVSVGGKVSTLIKTKPYEPEGVCLTDKEEIAVCLLEKDTVIRGSLTAYSPDGRRKLRYIRGVDSHSGQQLIRPRRVVCNGKYLCVVNGSNVVCVDESDNVKWMYDGKQARLGKSFYPHGICVDKYHNLLVTDPINNCIHYIDREGGLIQIILTQKQARLLYPLGISVDNETGHVWVGNDKCEVVISKYLK